MAGRNEGRSHWDVICVMQPCHRGYGREQIVVLILHRISTPPSAAPGRQTSSGWHGSRNGNGHLLSHRFWKNSEHVCYLYSGPRIPCALDADRISLITLCAVQGINLILYRNLAASAFSASAFDRAVCHNSWLMSDWLINTPTGDTVEWNRLQYVDSSSWNHSNWRVRLLAFLVTG